MQKQYKRNLNYNFMVNVIKDLATTQASYKKILTDLQESTADEINAIIWQLPRFETRAQVINYLQH